MEVSDSPAPDENEGESVAVEEEEMPDLQPEAPIPTEAAMRAAEEQFEEEAGEVVALPPQGAAAVAGSLEGPVEDRRLQWRLRRTIYVLRPMWEHRSTIAP